jgi:hypothetical protein
MFPKLTDYIAKQDYLRSPSLIFCLVSEKGCLSGADDKTLPSLSARAD